MVGRLRENYWFKEEVGALSEKTHFGTFDVNLIRVFFHRLSLRQSAQQLCAAGVRLRLQYST